jgi:hypothetical protein
MYYLMLLILWVVFIVSWWATHSKIEALEEKIEELSRRLDGSPPADRS